MRTFPARLRFATALLMVTYFGVLYAAPVAAGLVPSRRSESTTISCVRDADMLVIQRALENKIVAQKLRDYGVAPGDVRIRVANASDQDVHTLATASKGLPSGGDGADALITLLIIVLLVILILKLLDKHVIVR